MAHKKKKPDCLVAGVLALLTAFSPVVSVIPTYAASDNEMSTSVTIDNDPSPDIDSGGGSDGSDESGTAGVVIDNSDPSGSGQSNTGQSDISIEGDQGDGIVSETIGDTTGIDGIQVEDSGDGIQVEKGQDGDGILIDSSSLSGNDVQVEQAGESISVDQTMDENTESHTLRFDFVGEHGLVKITPKSGSATYDTRYIRVHENADDDKIASIYDKDRNLLYTSEVSNYVAFYQDSLPEGNAFTVEAIADYGYSVGTYSILIDSGAEDQEDVFDQTGFIADHYQKYTWDVVMNTDKSMRIAFTDSVDSNLEYENSIGLVDAKTLIDDTMQNTVSENSVSEDETDGQGFIVLSEDPTEEGHEVISSMADEVELPDITEKEEKQAIADPVYEGYVKDNLNTNLVHGDDLSIVSFMHVKQTLFDSTKMPALIDSINFNLDELMLRDDLANYFIGQMETVVPLYYVGEDSDYLVAYVNTMQRDTRSHVFDHIFSNANFFGEVLSGCVYDADTGLAYIPKGEALTSDGVPLGKVQIQLAQSIDYNIAYTESVAVMNDPDGSLDVDGFNMYDEVPSFNIGSGRDPEDLEVYLNGLPIYSDEEMWVYDSVTGELSINQSSALISSVNVRDSGQDVGFLGTVINNLFGLKTVHANPTISDWTDMESIGTLASESTVKVGDASTLKGTMVRSPNNGANDPSIAGRVKFYCYLPVSYSQSSVYMDLLVAFITGNRNSVPGQYSNPEVYFAFGTGNPTGITTAWAEKQALGFFLQASSLSSAGKKSTFEFKEVDDALNGDALLPLHCAHTNTPVTKNPITPDHLGVAYYHDVTFRFRVLAANTTKKYAVLGVMSQGVLSVTHPETGAQCGVGIFRVDLEDMPPSSVRVNKNAGTGGSLGGGCTGNELYNMEGALFGVYKTENAAKNANVIENTKDTSRDKPGDPASCIGVLKSKNAAGFTGYLELSMCYNDAGELKSGYVDNPYVYIRELKAPAGYSRNDKIVPVRLPAKANGKMITVDINDPPVWDPNGMEIIKVPEKMLTSEMTKPELMAAMAANDESMNGAQYSLKYYKCGTNANLDKRDPDVEATLQTTKVGVLNGMIVLDKPECYVGKCKVDGKATSKSWPYINSNGQCILPLGMYVLEETKPPEGYALKKGKMKVVGKCSRVTDDSGKNFTGKFSWLPDNEHGNNKDRMFTIHGWDNDFGAKYAYNEPSTGYNAAVYKTDKDADSADLGNRTFEGITFGLIWGEENEGEMPNIFSNEKVEPGSQIPGLEVTIEKGKSYGTTEKYKNGKGCLPPGTYYWIETKGNDVYLKSEDRIKLVIPNGGKAGTVYFPDKEGNGIPMEEALDKDGNPKDAVKPLENISPPMGVELDKTTWTNFGEMKSDDYILGDATYKDYIFGKQDIGDATLEGHTFAIFHTSENDIELKDGTKVKSAKDKLEDPDNPTWKELNNLYELTEGKIQENGYICDIIVTDEKGEAKTAPDAFSIGTYWVIEVATKEDYVVNNVDVGKVGGKEGVKANQLTEDGGLIKAVFEHNGETADDGACWNPPVSGGVHIQKLDEMRDDDREHGDLNLAATFKIINASKKAVKNKYGETIPTSGLTDKPRFPTYDQVRAASETCTVYEITADKNGKADTEEHDLVYGTYYIIETAVPDGYYLNTEWVGKVEIRKDGEIVPVGEANNELHDEYNHYYYDRSQKEPVVHPDDAVACRDMPYRGGVAVQKIDKEMGWQTAQGMGTLKGAEFTILNASGSSARNVDGKDVKSVTSRKDFQETYQQLWRIADETDSPYVMQRIYTNKEGFACTDKFDLPYGTYYIIETKAPVGYWLDEEFVGKIVIRDDGRCMMISDNAVKYEGSFDDYTSAHTIEPPVIDDGGCNGFHGRIPISIFFIPVI